MGAEKGKCNSGKSKRVKGVQCLKRKVIHDGLPISNGNGVVEEDRLSDGSYSSECGSGGFPYFRTY